MTRSARQMRHVGVGALFVGVVLAGLIAAMDGRRAWHLLRHADWGVLPAALACTALSYLCLSAGWAAVNRLFGIRLRGAELLEIGFVSFALNNLMSIGGLAGYSLRLWLLRRRGLATGDVLGASLVHSYFNHLIMMALLPVGLCTLLVDHPLGRTQTTALVAALGVAIAAMVVTTLLLVHARLRARVATLLAAASRRLMRRDPTPLLQRLDTTLGGGVAAMRARPAVLGAPLLLVIGDWLAAVVTLGLCFDAFGDPLHFGVLLTGFAIGVAAGLLSMLPGGIGVQEGSMTGTYVLLGVDLEHAVLASLLFRIVYYVVPFGASLPLYARLLRRTPPPSEPGAP